MTIQLTMFGEQPEDVMPESTRRHSDISMMAWSYSRRTTLDQCVRRYYYEYFGGSKRNAKDEADKEQIAFLRQLSNRYERAGELLHLAIGSYFRKARDGNPWKEGKLESWIREVFHKDIVYSQSYFNTPATLEQKFPPKLLSEFYFKRDDALETCLELEERLFNAITTFTRSAVFEEFREEGKNLEALIEHPIKMHEGFLCRVDGRIDLSFRKGGRITVVDWKLGVDDGSSEESLQLAIYGLWAIGHFHCDIGSLRICKAYLGSNLVTDFVSTETLLEAARARIVQDARRMLLMDSYGRAARSEAFMPCLQERVCRNCTFLEVCPEGRELTYD